MNIEENAKEFAIEAHNGQVRKSDPDKPMIIHPINVANILKEAGLDSNVVAAGYLHDVVEDTKYTEEDILKTFGEDICSLVMGASEEDKSKSWEERKQGTIVKVKNLDFRHKAVVCADKISNLEDMMILFEKKQNYDFSKFKRGQDKQKWYYEGVYKSLIYNEDENIEMFKKLKYLIDYVFNNIKEDKSYLFDIKNEYIELVKLYYKRLEICKLNKILDSNKPYVIEFNGTPRTGKTTLINNLNEFFKKGGFKVGVVEEFTTSKKYKEEIYPELIKNNDKKTVYKKILEYVYLNIEEELKKDYDIILIDRGIVDRLIWIERLFQNSGISEVETDEIRNKYSSIVRENINIIISTYTDSMTSLKRDYQSSLALDKRSFLNIDNIDEYNKAFLSTLEYLDKEKIKYYKIDTTNNSLRDESISTCRYILDSMRGSYVEEANKVFKKV